MSKRSNLGLGAALVDWTHKLVDGWSLIFLACPTYSAYASDHVPCGYLR